MKRTVKSIADLRRMALQQGAEVEVSGTRFNSTMDRASPGRMPPPPPPPTPAPAPVVEPPAPAPAVAHHTEQVQINMDMRPVADAVQQGNERVVEVIRESLRQVQVPTKSSGPTSWLFTINRDTRGFIQSVEANPVQK